MTTPAISNKEIVNLFYTRASDTSNVWKCQCGTSRTQNGTGFSNLMQHLDRKHPAEVKEARARKLASYNQRSLSSLLYCPKVVAVHGWLCYVIHCLRPFSVVNNDDVRAHIRYDRISLNTFKTYLAALTTRVELKISTALPDRFALVFDGQTTPEAHYVAVFATYPNENASGYLAACLAMSPLEDETTHSAEEHVEFLRFVLSVFGKDVSNVVALIADNCNVNRSISTKMGVPLIGCASHRFQLAVKEILKEDEGVITQVKQLMTKLRTPLISAKLRRETHLKPKLKNDTRWSSTFLMLLRHAELREHVLRLDDMEIDALLLSPASERKVDNLIRKLRELDEVTKKLQRADCTIRVARAYFDTVLEDYPTLSDRLDPDARIVLNPQFESGLLKIQAAHEHGLTPGEREKVSGLLLRGEATAETGVVGTSIVERAAKRLRGNGGGEQDSLYMDTRFLLPTSNMCERFFSIAGYALSNRRKGLLPSNFEAQLFLCVNRDFWGIEDVREIIKG